MSYTPTNWVTGDTITATKLNNMEQGIANAGGAYPMAEITTLGFSSATQNVGAFAYANPRDGGGYNFVNFLGPFGTTEVIEGSSLVFYGDVTFKIIVPYITQVGDAVLVFISDGVTLSNLSGGISSASVNVYHSWGSYSVGYIITGDFSATINS